ncbi:hypothetical protein EMWEY_00046400 [Eimeria maxima]|uniref:Uncharacterized protein n=1 Tax=Eimeria maxima TaxID=5804 RepID=U6MHH4_EIMMA|nr:hypothetical protein EMWEY_00046400 [Eimeria maxima]CDJ61919.1 hypothetical protein EMWEY_00046400 [Eimeria maxima]
MGRLWLPADERRGACLLYSCSCDCSDAKRKRRLKQEQFSCATDPSDYKDCLTCRREENGGSYVSTERVGLSSAEAYVEWCDGCWCERAMNMGRLWLPADERRGACLMYSRSSLTSDAKRKRRLKQEQFSCATDPSVMKDCLTCRREEKDGSSLSLGIE